MSELTNVQLGEEIQRLAAHIDAALCEWLGMIAEFDRREAWGELGLASTAQWLSWRCSIGPGTAREHVRVARALDELPLTRVAFARGELSYSKVRAITRVDNVAREAELLELAQYATAADLERIVGAYRGVTREAAERAIDTRYVTLDQADDGSWVLRGRLPAEDGALLVRALEAAGEAVDVPAGTPVGRKTRSIPPSIRRALRARDAGCQFPGCTCTRWLDAHHIEHWARGGQTDLNNLVQLCRRHHRLVHEGDWTLERARDGGFVFLSPTGNRLVNLPPRRRGDCGALIDQQRSHGIAPPPDALVPGWTGDKLNLGYAVDAILDFTDGDDPGEFAAAS